MPNFTTNRAIDYTNFRENDTKALIISKSLKFPYDDRTDTNLIALLRMQF